MILRNQGRQRATEHHAIVISTFDSEKWGTEVVMVKLGTKRNQSRRELRTARIKYSSPQAKYISEARVYASKLEAHFYFVSPNEEREVKSGEQTFKLRAHLA